MSRDKIINYKSENYKTCKHCINQVHKDCINIFSSSLQYFNTFL